MTADPKPVALYRPTLRKDGNAREGQQRRADLPDRLRAQQRAGARPIGAQGRHDDHDEDRSMKEAPADGP